MRSFIGNMYVIIVWAVFIGYFAWFFWKGYQEYWQEKDDKFRHELNKDS